MNTLRIVNGVADHFMVRLPEWAGTVALLLFGATLLQAGNTFSMPTFVIMAEISGENTWGALILGVALARLAVLLLDGTGVATGRPAFLARAGVALASGLLWGLLAVCLFMGSRLTPGPKIYAALSAVDLVTAWYLLRHAERLGRTAWTMALGRTGLSGDGHPGAP